MLASVLLREKRHGVLARYGATAALVGVAFMLRLAMANQLHDYPVLLFIPAVFMSALLFDRGSGFFATFLSAVLIAYFFMAPAYSFAIGWPAVVPLGLYILIGLAVSALTEALRSTAERLRESQHHEVLLREELSHRTKNDLMMVVSVLTLQAKGLDDTTARAVLESAIGRIDVIAKAHERLSWSGQKGLVAIDEYLESLCRGLGDLLRGVRPIAVQLRVDPIDVPPKDAVSLGLMVNELVTNAFKYAYPNNEGGIVKVDLHRLGGHMLLSVEDDGIGRPTDAGSGLGTRLIDLLAGQMGGAVERLPREIGCRIVIQLPMAAGMAHGYAWRSRQAV